MIYDHLGVTVSTSRPRTFFQRMFPRFFPYPQTFFPQPQPPACIPVGPLPAGTLGRDSNGNLTINGQTYCRPGAPSYSAPAFFPAVPRFRIF